MGFPAFPCRGVRVEKGSPQSNIDAFLKQRPSHRWVLLGGHAVMGDEQLWTAWIQATRNALRGRMVARSIDAEFLRYLAGTHHISEAFNRAGLQEGQPTAWVVYLPEADGVENDLGHQQPKALAFNDFETSLMSLLNGLGWSEENIAANFSIEGAEQLGIDAEGWSEERAPEAVVAHILMADDQSSSHR